jgi:hypothetical protein
MENLRRRRVAGKTALQTPIVSLKNSRDGRSAKLVLTAHLGEAAYFEKLNRAIAAAGAPVFYESVRPTSDDPHHWEEPYHRFLRSLREDLYHGIAGLGMLAFQGDCLAPEPGWVNADVDCCELAARLREAGVPLFRYEIAFGLLRQLIQRARHGDSAALKTLERAIKWGLIAVSVTAVFKLVQLLPRTRSLYAVINDWRSARAVEAVEKAGGDFLLIYGAAHGETLLQGLKEHGFRETGREWHTVLVA